MEIFELEVGSRVRKRNEVLKKNKSCGRPAAYTKKYIVGEELGITLTSILQTFNLKMEEYEGKYEEI